MDPAQSKGLNDLTQVVDLRFNAVIGCCRLVAVPKSRKVREDDAEFLFQLSADIQQRAAIRAHPVNQNERLTLAALPISDVGSRYFKPLVRKPHDLQAKRQELSCREFRENVVETDDANQNECNNNQESWQHFCSPQTSSLSFNQSCRRGRCTDESHFKRSSLPTPRPENSRHAQQPHGRQPCVQQPWAWSHRLTVGTRVDLCRPKSDLPVESLLQKYFHSLRTQITCISL